MCISPGKEVVAPESGTSASADMSYNTQNEMKCTKRCNEFAECSRDDLLRSFKLQKPVAGVAAVL